jgi:hypothetical protein
MGAVSINEARPTYSSLLLFKVNDAAFDLWTRTRKCSELWGPFSAMTFGEMSHKNQAHPLLTGKQHTLVRKKMTEKQLSATVTRTISRGNTATSLLFQMKHNHEAHGITAVVGQSTMEPKHWMARKELLLQTLNDAISLLEE